MGPGREVKLVQVLNQRQTNLTLILENVFDPHNISAVMRTCDAVGIREIYVVNTRFPKHGRYGPRSSSSASKWVHVHEFDALQPCIEAVRSQYDFIYATHLKSDAVSVFEMDFSKSMALIFGNEQRGCSDEILAHADGNFVIPQVGVIESLNISVACAITLYEAFRQKQQAGHYDATAPTIPEGELQSVYREWKMFDYLKR